MKNSFDTIGNRTLNPPACSAVPEPTAAPRAPVGVEWLYINEVGGMWKEAIVT